MLHKFRTRGLTNIVYGVVIIATVLVFVIQFGPQAGKKTASCAKTCFATIRGHCIESKSVKAELNLMALLGGQFAQRGERGAGIGGYLQQNAGSLVRDGLIDRELLVAEAERLGISVGNDEFNEQIHNGFARVTLPQETESLLSLVTGSRDPSLVYLGELFDAKGDFDLKNYKSKIFHRVELTEADFREEQRRAILAAKMKDIVRASVRVGEPEEYQTWFEEHDTADLEHVVVRERFVRRWGLALNQDEIDKWAKANTKAIDDAFEKQKDKDFPKEKRIRHILLSFREKPSPISETEEQKAFARARASVVYARLKAGESFPEVAREVSDDPGSASKGGGYEESETGQFETSFKNAMEKLKPGQMTEGVVRTPFGYHIIMKDDPAKKPDEAAMKRGIARLLYIEEVAKPAEKAKELTQKVLEALKAGKTTDEAIKSVFAGWRSSAPPAPLVTVLADTPVDATGDAGVAAAADASVTATGDAGAPHTPEGTSAAAYLPENDWEHPSPGTTGGLTRSSNGVEFLSSAANSALLEFAFKAKEKDVLPNPVETSGGGWAVFREKERHVPTREEFDKALAKEAEHPGAFQTMEAEKQIEALNTYMKQLHDAAKREDALKLAPVADAGVAADAGATEDKK